MRYREVLSQAYTLTVRNPLLWLFGLVMLGGFNLSLINFYSLLRGENWKELPVLISGFLGHPSTAWLAVAVVTVASFLIINLIKIVFVVVLHDLLHESRKDELLVEKQCMLCLKKEKHLPHLFWLPRVVAASAITVGLTAGIAFAANQFVNMGGYDGPVVISVNLIIIAFVAAMLGIWNAFVNYYVVFHDLNFAQASSAAIDLMVWRARRVFEFIIILSVIHTVSVVIANAFIKSWPDGSNIFFIAQAVSIIWFAVNNAFFNVAFIVFFDSLVKSIPAEKPASRLLPENRLN